MAEIYTLFAFFIGIPLLVIGWIWSVVATRSAGAKWLIPMILIFPLALPTYGLIYWSKIKGPFIITTFGMVLLLGTTIVVP
jgi:hypothetical protein